MKRPRVLDFEFLLILEKVVLKEDHLKYEQGLSTKKQTKIYVFDKNKHSSN